MGALVSQHILVLLGDGTKITVHTVIWGKRSQEADMGNTVVQQGEGSHLGREISSHPITYMHHLWALFYDPSLTHKLLSYKVGHFLPSLFQHDLTHLVRCDNYCGHLGRLWTYLDKPPGIAEGGMYPLGLSVRGYVD
jgi:hypothetical protein